MTAIEKVILPTLQPSGRYHLQMADINKSGRMTVLKKWGYVAQAGLKTGTPGEMGTVMLEHDSALSGPIEATTEQFACSRAMKKLRDDLRVLYPFSRKPRFIFNVRIWKY